MTNFQAYGLFLKREEHFFRKAAYLQWGESSKSLGCCLLLNPGSASLERTEPHLFKQLLVNEEAQGQVTADPTMKQLAEFLERIYGGEIEGRFHIYNLFWLQNTDDQDAIEQYVDLVKRKTIDCDESLIEKAELQQHPWILLGWGVKPHKRHWHPLAQIKEHWLSLIQASGVPHFGKPHPTRKSGYYYYHPCPQIPNQRPLIIDDLYELYQISVASKQNTHSLTTPRH
ncbi:MAG: DUF1643 domain-containing protein [Paenibacillus macerans]|uniref:DUF1643 domain-containing protein n=1 Tax=Paenibacillus macerans TaxID=44252 RepID=UPI00242CFACB|nr:DUF1643 domain-containing protein [Paenibacillus macerans]MBS5913803.1 DUF1643 domain-containing protein [Paenibacillus macerans]MDU5947350.1 DUF1643 domain-containing protein [Paenibacillus macerans]